MSVPDWPLLLETDEQHSQAKLLRHTTLRISRKIVQRRITSSVHSDRICAVDGCWVAKDNVAYTNLYSEIDSGNATQNITSSRREADTRASNAINSGTLINSSSSPSSFSSSSSLLLPPLTSILSSSTLSNLQSHIIFGLSNGAICVMNTSALTKVYLFEAATDRKRYISSNEATKEIYVTLDTILLPANAICTNAKVQSQVYCVMCVVRNKTVQICVFNVDAFAELKKLRDVSASTIAYYPIIKNNQSNNINNNNNNWNTQEGIKLPANLLQVNSASYGVPTVRFSLSGENVIIILPCIHTLGVCHQILVLEKKKVSEINLSTSSSLYVVANSWRSVSLSSASEASRMWYDAYLMYCDWWDISLLLLIFSNGHVIFLDPITNIVHGEAEIIDSDNAFCSKECITSATCTRCSVKRQSRSSIENTSNTSSCGIIAVTYSFNVVATFTMHVYDIEPVSNENSGDHTSNCNKVQVHFIPTLQTYSAEDNSVRELKMLNVFSWLLCVLLESGGLLFFNALTMEKLSHSAFQRSGLSRTVRNDMLWLEAIRARYKNAANISQLSSPRSHQLCLSQKPTALCIIDGNTAFVLRN